MGFCLNFDYRTSNFEAGKCFSTYRNNILPKYLNNVSTFNEDVILVIIFDLKVSVQVLTFNLFISLQINVIYVLNGLQYVVKHEATAWGITHFINSDIYGFNKISRTNICIPCLLFLLVFLYV